MTKKDKQAQQPPQIVVNITPRPLPDASAYYVGKHLTSEERAAFRLAWRKVQEEAGTNRICIVIPEGVDIGIMGTPALQQLRKQIDESLKERGADVPAYGDGIHIHVTPELVNCGDRDAIYRAVRSSLDSGLVQRGVI
jgi:hypothetical protein